MNKKQLIVAWVAYFSIFTSVIFAQEKEQINKSFDNCMDKAQANTVAISNCSYATEKQWDEVLNKYYKLLRGILDKESRSKLKESQRAWIMFRDKEGENILSVYINNKEGTAYHNIAASEISNLVEQRAIQLKAYYDLLMEDKK